MCSPVKTMGYRGSRATNAVLSFSLSFLFGSLSGCGSGGSTVPEASPLIIVTQPANQTVPLNQTATFTVAASGGTAPYLYQWTKDGAPLGGATGNAYTTPAVGLSDDNEIFAVTVTDTHGNVISNPATLTVGPRFPNPLNLRFQQVAAPSTVNGYGAVTGESTNVDRSGFGIDPGLGTPLPLGAMTCAKDTNWTIAGCAWEVSVFPLPSGPDIATNYYGDSLDYFDHDLTSSRFGMPVTQPNAVVMSLHISSAANFFGIAYMTTKQTTGFQLEQHTIPFSSLQEAADQEGTQSRVITAITYNAGQVKYFSYGWTADIATIYETKVYAATLDTVSDEAASLAAQGYIITAFGGNTSDGFILVGTRVKGDSLPRPLRSVPQGQQGTQLWMPGYAIVAVLEDADYHLTYIGER